MANDVGFGWRRSIGFHITFENGWTVSVQYGPGSYSGNRDGDFEGKLEREWHSGTAEIAAWDAAGEWFQFEHDSVEGWQSPADVLAFMQRIAALPSGVPHAG